MKPYETNILNLRIPLSEDEWDALMLWDKREWDKDDPKPPYAQLIASTPATEIDYDGWYVGRYMFFQVETEEEAQQFHAYFKRRLGPYLKQIINNK